MNTLTNIPRRTALYGAMLAMAALVITLLAVNFAAGPALAQNADNTYPDPQPCGPGAATAFMEEPHELTSGHYALFDSYWQWTKESTEDDPGNEGVLHTNECPPKVTQTTETVHGEAVTVTTRSASNIDIEEAIMHVLDKHKADVVATNAEITKKGQLSLEEYPDVREALGLEDDDPVEAGTQVWWLRLDDPDTTGKDETSDLILGFSTALFDEKYWLREDEGQPMRYMLETERYPGSDPAEVPHVLAYEAPKANNGTQQDAVLNSANTDVDIHDMKLDPGEHRDLQWVFTGKGTYLLSVHLQGFVRNEENKLDGAGDDWKPISSYVDKTGEVKRYTIQVGSALDETEPPLFEFSRSLKENSAAGTNVGKPVSVRYEADVANLSFSLAGDGAENFTVANVNGAAQVKVAANAILDYETYPNFDLTLRVTDGHDHEGNKDPSPPHIDHTVGLGIELENVWEDTAVTIRASKSNPKPNEEVTIRAILGDPAFLRGGIIRQEWRERDTGGDWTTLAFPSTVWSITVQHGAGVTKEYALNFWTDDGQSTTTFGDGPITVTWGNSPSN